MLYITEYVLIYILILILLSMMLYVVINRFLSEKLMWNEAKINNILVPIIKKMEKNKVVSNNDKKQTKLDQYFFNPKSIMESNKIQQSQRIKSVIDQWSKKK